MAKPASQFCIPNRGKRPRLNADCKRGNQRKNGNRNLRQLETPVLTTRKRKPRSTGTIEERLARLATATVQLTLGPERLGLMRMAVAEARRFPDLAATVSQTARQLSTEVAARYLGEMTQSDPLGSLPAFAPERLATTARFFLDLVVVPFLLRALFELNPKTLQAEIGPHVARNVAFFLAACRHGGVS